jgi:hypothetical protein
MKLTFGDGSGERIKSLGVHKPEEIAQSKDRNGKRLDPRYRIHMCPWSLERNTLVCFRQNKKAENKRKDRH